MAPKRGTPDHQHLRFCVCRHREASVNGPFVLASSQTSVEVSDNTIVEGEGVVPLTIDFFETVASDTIWKR